MPYRATPTRRLVLSGLALSVAGPQAAWSAAPGGEPELLVAGPPHGRLDSWSAVLAPAIGRGMPGRGALLPRNVGGIDGVTGANQFDARVEPDGSTALLIPGTAALCWLTGEPRARFDFSLWIPLWAGMGSAVLVSREPLSNGGGVRLRASGPTGINVPALLALDLLGVTATVTPPDAADATVLQGPDLVPALRRAAGLGMRPVMTFGMLGSEGSMLRDAAFPTVPTAFELVGERAPEDMLHALRAAAVAVQLDAVLMLPALTPAASVSVWRSACNAMQSDSAVQEAAAQLGASCVYPDAVSSYTARVSGSRNSLLALREWLATRYDLRPT